MNNREAMQKAFECQKFKVFSPFKCDISKNENGDYVEDETIFAFAWFCRGIASQAQQPTKLVFDSESARQFLLENVLPKFSDSTFQKYVLEELAGDFAYQLVMYLQSQAQQDHIPDVGQMVQGCKECDGQTYMHSQTGEYLGECPYCSKEQDPYAYDVPTEDGTELAYAIYFTKYNNPLPKGAIPLYASKQEPVSPNISALNRIAKELKTYIPEADEYKGKFIHKVWAKEIESALPPAPEGDKPCEQK